MKTVYFIALLTVIGLAACRDDARQQTATPPPFEIILRQEWIPNSNYVGAVLAARDFAKKRNIRIAIQPGTENVDPIKLLLAGQATVADVGGDKVLLEAAQGADLVVIGVLNRQSPVCFIAKANKNVRSPKDFEGKRVGVLPGTATELVYRTLVLQQKLNKKLLREQNVPFDLNTFLLDQYDIRPAFIYDEPVSLELEKVPYTLIEPRHYNVSFLGTVYVTSRAVFTKHPDALAAFVAAVADGWKAALKYPDQAIDALATQFKDIDKKRELLSLKKAAPYFQGSDGRVLHSDEADWRGTVQALKDLGELKNDVDLSRLVHDGFLRKYEDSLATRK